MPSDNEREASGPGLVAKKFDINSQHDNLPLGIENEIWITKGLIPDEMKKIITTTRIGIKEAKDLPWRWYLQRSRSISKRAKGDRTPSLKNCWRPTNEDGP